MQPAPEPTHSERPERLSPHPAAALVPEPSAEEYRALLDDIHRHGVQVPLEVTAEGVVLDGRQRLKAARQLAHKRVPVRVVVPEDELAYILRCALRRRHLSASQKAALAVQLEEVEREREQARRRSLANLQGDAEVATLPPRGEKTRELAARIVGCSPRTIQDAITVRQADAELFEDVKAGRIAVDKAARRIRQQQKREQVNPDPVMPDGPFQLIYADPPWQLGGDPESAFAPENHYPCLPLQAIKELQVPSAEEAVLFLWTACGVLPGALEVMEAWGFDYRANLVWDKGSIGLGNWVRYQHELLLIGRKGRFPAPEREIRPASVIQAPRGRHSQKPDVFYELLERLYPDALKLELFCRQARPGWAAFGNEVAA